MVLLLIVTEIIHRTLAALLGAALMVVYGIIPSSEVFALVDFETIGVLVGMMIVVEVVSTTGLFQLIAIKTAKVAKGNSANFFIFFMGLTTFFSAFLTDAATMLIMASITIMIARITKMNPVPFLVWEVVFTNIGGLTTLISSVPSIMVGAEANLSFIDFLVNLGPLVLIFFAGTICLVRIVTKGGFPKLPNADKILEIDEWDAVENRKFFWRALLVLAATVIAFIVGGPFGLSPSLVALGGGIAMLLLSGVSPEKTLREIDWSTIFFFVGIFVALGGLERVGIFGEVVSLIRLVGSNPAVAGISILYFSSFASVAVHNIVITAVLIPIVRDLITMLGTMATPLWWTLVVGATLGGSMIPIGSVAGVIALGVAEREGHTISMKEFMKIGASATFTQMGLATAYFVLRYFMPTAI
jgi:Na+/H+ antiporter NhaD/arsenite permease-like protein